MKTAIVPIKNLAPEQVSRMYEIMVSYYDHILKDQFQKDLMEKDSVILLADRENAIQGFSTLLSRDLDVNGQKILCLYSGDTVLDRAYWGNGALGIAFGRYLLSMKIRNLSRPVYWFLISKGYKTYLLMANNFPEHYPRYERSTPSATQDLMHAFYSKKFGNRYNSTQGLIEPVGEACAVKVHVADIDTDLLKIPRIKFFAEKNPRWQEGTELVCVAKVTLWVPAKYVAKRIYKLLQKPFKYVKALQNQVTHSYQNHA
ncbi:hypothetical protein [Bdellovibrio sp. HCB337]|uniref:hypothetical protein n=1 Tax=Bdellovibrio sp. HCB337 TaxID=3394358 RepID=UPI0039A50EB8